MYLDFIRLVVSTTLCLTLACRAGPSGVVSDPTVRVPRVANLHAFARLYGVVRWFHPSDAAAVIDWDRFAIEGVKRVVDATDVPMLRARLAELFAPIAPTMTIVDSHQAFPNKSVPGSQLHPGANVVTWQHKGFGDSTVASGYASKRRHRDRTVAVPGVLFVSLSQSVDATPYRGLRIRLRGKLRTANHARGRLWLRVDHGESRGFFDNMERHPVMSEEWAPAEIIGTVDSNATRIVFGVLMLGMGTAWYDDLEVAVEASGGAWKRIDIEDGGFEAPDPLASWRSGTRNITQPQSIDGWKVRLDYDRPASGSSCLRIEAVTKVVTEELFDQAAAPGETVDIDLGRGLRARVPIALYSQDNHTIGDDPEAARREQAAYASRRSGGFDAMAGAADIIVLWNVFQHFWPYWDAISVNWNAQLDIALAHSLEDHNVDEHLATLKRLAAAVPDGHVSVSCPGESDLAYLPFALDVVESQIVVTASADPAVKRGDILISVDGQPAVQLLAEERALISGSPQWQIATALQRLARGPLGSKLTLRVRRGVSDMALSSARIDRRMREDPSHLPIQRLDDGIYYLDLSRTSMSDIKAIMNHLVSAPGIVFDVREYPRLNHEVLSHLLTRIDELKGWELIPLVIRPDSPSRPAGWEDTSTWNMPLISVAKPHIGAKVAFLIGPRAISYAESVMALVNHYHLGEIVGTATAGTNGDIAQITMPTGCSTNFTGRRVTKPDGSPHHLIGVEPTIPVSRTIAGVLAGRDDVLEGALAYLRGTSR
jgi:hypothetical protein